ncbi:MAG TPA: glycosyltransferase family 39 protein, partial [Anaerolineae bacterium]|nr:glycosyltransferase family 39 protein [Anaerolineae bacterium]
MTRYRLVLGIILFFQLVFGVMYTVRTPHWEAPDEPAHYNYVRVLAETGTFPILQQGDYDQAYLEQIKTEKFPADMSVDTIRYESHQPPLYYVLAAPFYLVARDFSVDSVLVLRLLNVALALVLSLIAFKIFRLVFPTNALLSLVAVGIIATLPMHIAMSAAINNDTLAEVVVALILLLAILRVQGKIVHRRFVILGGVLYGSALLTKTTIY